MRDHEAFNFPIQPPVFAFSRAARLCIPVPLATRNARQVPRQRSCLRVAFVLDNAPGDWQVRGSGTTCRSTDIGFAFQIVETFQGSFRFVGAADSSRVAPRRTTSRLRRPLRRSPAHPTISAVLHISILLTPTKWSSFGALLGSHCAGREPEIN